MKVALASLRRARGLGLDETLAQEYRVALRSLAGPDFREGIRAQVVDKDRNPQWRPRVLSEVQAHDVERYFSRWGRENWFCWRGKATTPEHAGLDVAGAPDGSEKYVYCPTAC